MRAVTHSVHANPVCKLGGSLMLRRVVPFATLLVAMLLTSGCLIETTLNANGAGTMKVSYRVGKDGTLETERKKMESEHVSVTNATIDEEKRVSFELKFEDTTKLSSAKFFDNVTFTLADDAEGARVLTARLVNKKPITLPEEQLDYFGETAKISVTLPGEIVKSNASATQGTTATWLVPMNDMLGEAEVPFTVTFKKPAEEKPAEEKSPEPSKEGDE